MPDLQQIVLAKYCEGAPKPSDFRLETQPLPEPKDGQFRVAHVWCSVDPGTR
ncbi:MAG: NADP-dependent oxidoreductase, partial [Gemmobacter sp.]